MAETYTINGVAMRENSVGTAILLSILTIGIYWFILVYRNTVDLHKASGKETTLPVLLFVAGIFFAPIMIALFSLNGIVLNDLRRGKGKEADLTWVIALLLHFVLAFVGSIVWAVHYDNAIKELATVPDVPDFSHVA